MKIFRRQKLVVSVLVVSIIIAISAAVGFAAWPVQQYGAPNASISEKLKEWKEAFFETTGLDYSYLPIALPGHGTDTVGELGTIATNEELEAYLNQIQKKSNGTMQWKYVYEYDAVDNDGELEVPNKKIKLPFAVFSKEGVFEPEDVKALKRPVVWLQGQIHGNESSGSESMQVLSYRLTQGDLKYILNKVIVVMLPRANPEGAWRWERGNNSGINNGGVALIDPNRDNIWFSALLQRAVHKTMNAYAPHMVIDQHEMGHRVFDEYAYVKSGDEQLEVKTGNTTDQAFDVSILNAPHPAVNRKIAKYGIEVVEQDWRKLLKDRGLRWTVYEAFGGPYGGTKKVEGLVLSGDAMVPGYRTQYEWILEADGDPRMVDPSYGLKGAVSFLTETPSKKPRVLMNSRTMAHNTVAESLLLTAYNRADDLYSTINTGREETTTLGKTINDSDKLILGYKNAPNYDVAENCTESITEHWLTLSKDETGKIITIEMENEVKVGRMAWDEYPDGPNKGKKRFGYVPASVITRPYAYIFTAEPAILDRLACTGVRIDRLTEDVKLDVVAMNVTNIGSKGRYNSLVCDDVEQAFYFNVSGDMYEKKDAEFKKGAYVMYMAQPIAPYGALALDPQSCWNYANAATVIKGNGVKGQLLTAEVGKDHPVFRIMSAADLPTEQLANFAVFVGSEIPRPVDIDAEKAFITKAEKVMKSAATKPVDLYIPTKGYVGTGAVNNEHIIPMDTLTRLYRAMGGDGRAVNGAKWAFLNISNDVELVTPTKDGITLDKANFVQTAKDGSLFLRVTAEAKEVPTPNSDSSGCNAGAASILIFIAVPILFINKKRNNHR